MTPTMCLTDDAVMPVFCSVVYAESPLKCGPFKSLSCVHDMPCCIATGKPCPSGLIIIMLPIKP
jgi:hypothetical protein